MIGREKRKNVSGKRERKRLKRWTVIGQGELVRKGREKERDRQKEREIEVVCLV